MSEFRTGIQERGISVFSKRRGLSIRHIIGIGVALSITIISGILLWNTGSFTHVLAVYDSHAIPQASTNNLIHNDKKSGTVDTVRIKTLDIDWYTFATVDGPMKVLSGQQVNFILDLTGTSSSTNSIVVTITGDGGQYVLFFPNSQDHKFVDKIQFQYAFPSPGTYNVDITFGGPAAANFNVNVANKVSVA
jgi:hypothetical protein